MAELDGRFRRRQLDGQIKETSSEWMWVTTLSSHRATTPTVVQLGHARWDIENRGFNETVNRWHADHVYKHDAGAMLAFWLLAMIAFNLFHAFCFRNLKPVVRKRYSLLHLARWPGCGIAERRPPGLHALQILCIIIWQLLPVRHAARPRAGTRAPSF